MSLAGKVAFITGASRGIGRAIALKLASAGANIVVVSKTADPNPKLPGTIFSAAADIEKAGGKALPVATDIRYEEQVEAAVKQAVERFGGIDILVNNASAIWLKGTAETNGKRYDLMNQINARGTYVCSRACLPYLKISAQKGRNPHILNLSPPLNMNPRWFKDHVAYTIAKYGMSMCALGHSEEFKEFGIAVNCLWPRTGIATAAIEFIAGKDGLSTCRTTDIMADAAEIILSRKASDVTGQFFIDDEVLLASGYTAKDLEKYAISPGSPLMSDFFLEPTDIPHKARL